MRGCCPHRFRRKWDRGLPAGRDGLMRRPIVSRKERNGFTGIRCVPRYPSNADSRDKSTILSPLCPVIAEAPVSGDYLGYMEVEPQRRVTSEPSRSVWERSSSSKPRPAIVAIYVFIGLSFRFSPQHCCQYLFGVFGFRCSRMLTRHTTGD